ncbi:MAG: hypothetical protein QOG01_2902 [Pseudonocardiales bacterium]|jgi:hypothetical protein|nr:hypothetical protein [Pseudonocardiales bacterium]
MITEAPPVPVFHHLHRLTDECALFEHADHTTPLKEHGYRVDDVARALVVVSREPRPAPNVSGISRRYLEFVLAALHPSGTCHNRMAVDRAWVDEPGVGDWWGRAIWGLGVAAGTAQTTGMQARALAGFRVAAQQRSTSIRSMAFAALGAADVLDRRPDERPARALLSDAVETIWWDNCDPEWPWPEPRLGYANATLAEALIVGGETLSDHHALSRGLEMLDFILTVDQREGHLSVTPVGGRGPEDTEAGFEQRPIEVATIADACATAYRVTLDRRWLTGIQLAWRWFLGDNDSETPMFDPATGGAYDGLERDGHNVNQGAESTLAMLSTAQHARRIAKRR